MKEFTDEDKKLFGWIPLYEGIADKLLDYKDRRSELVSYVKSSKSGVGYKKLTDDIDPFTVIGMFNRIRPQEEKITAQQNRKPIAKNLAIFLGIKSPELNHFDIRVRLAHTGFTYLYGKKNKSNDINSLWAFFEAALLFSESNNQDEEIKRKFTKLYDKVIKQDKMRSRWNITMSVILDSSLGII